MRAVQPVGRTEGTAVVKTMDTAVAIQNAPSIADLEQATVVDLAPVEQVQGAVIRVASGLGIAEDGRAVVLQRASVKVAVPSMASRNSHFRAGGDADGAAAGHRAVAGTPVQQISDGDIGRVAESGVTFDRKVAHVNRVDAEIDLPIVNGQ